MNFFYVGGFSLDPTTQSPQVLAVDPRTNSVVASEQVELSALGPYSSGLLVDLQAVYGAGLQIVGQNVSVSGFSAEGATRIVFSLSATSQDSDQITHICALFETSASQPLLIEHRETRAKPLAVAALTLATGDGVRDYLYEPADDGQVMLWEVGVNEVTVLPINTSLVDTFGWTVAGLGQGITEVDERVVLVADGFSGAGPYFLSLLRKSASAWERVGFAQCSSPLELSIARGLVTSTLGESPVYLAGSAGSQMAENLKQAQFLQDFGTKRGYQLEYGDTTRALSLIDSSVADVGAAVRNELDAPDFIIINYPRWLLVDAELPGFWTNLVGASAEPG